MNLKLEITEIVLQDILLNLTVQNSITGIGLCSTPLDGTPERSNNSNHYRRIQRCDWQKEYNEILSLKRAQTVKEYFVKNGVADSRISIQGKGPVNPVAINTNDDGSDNPEGRKYNRRVNLQLDTNQAKFVIRRVNIVPTELLVK